MQTIIFHVGKERNMTFPKDKMEELELTPIDLSGASIVCQLEKVVTGNGRVIETKELDRLLKSDTNVIQ